APAPVPVPTPVATPAPVPTPTPVPVGVLSAPTNLTGQYVATFAGQTMALSWNVPTGAVGSKLYKNGALLNTIQTAMYYDFYAKPGDSYAVAAYDASGNVSAVSNT